MPYSYRELCRVLTEAGISEPQEESVCLLTHFARVSRVRCLTDPAEMHDSPGLDEAVARRLTHYPLQYILGTWDFYGCTFVVNEHCLIPRPDTECLVDLAVRTLPPGAVVADLCTGSGCIAVALLKARPDISVVALELYPDTLSVAKENAERNGVSDRLTCLCADVLDGGADQLAAHPRLDAILSNPPYIPTQVVDDLAPELFCEPRAALDGGEDGLTFYRAILSNYSRCLKAGGHILLEIGYDQGDSLRALVTAHLPQAAMTVTKDLGGNDRVVAVTLPATTTTHQSDEGDRT